MYFPIDDILNDTFFGIPIDDSIELSNILVDIYNNTNEE